MQFHAKFRSTHSKWRLMGPVVFIGVMGLVLLTVNGQSKTNKSKSSKVLSPRAPVLSAREIANYKKWQVVNPQTFRMAQEVAVYCAPPSRLPVEKISLKSSHRSSHPSTKDKFIRVFVNEKGRFDMFIAEKPRFSEGSVIVKEKLPNPDSTRPELLTVMIKRRAGYDPKKGDWEYLVTDGTGKKVYERGKINNCQRCHVTQSANDYVFRPYLKLAQQIEKSTNSSKSN